MLGLRKKSSNDLEKRISELQAEIASLNEQAATKQTEAAEAFSADSAGGDRLASEAAAISAKIAGRQAALEKLRTEHRDIREAEKTEALRKRAESTVTEAVDTAKMVRRDMAELLKCWNRVIRHEASRQALDITTAASGPITLLKTVANHSSLQIVNRDGPVYHAKQVDIDAVLAALDERINRDKSVLIDSAMRARSQFGGM